MGEHDMTDAWDGANRRQFPRIVYPCLVKVTCDGEPRETFLTHTENISVGGISVIVKKEIRVFSTIEVEIDLIEDPEHIVATGRVVWSVRRKAIESVKPMFYDIGIQFDDIKDKDKTRLGVAISKFIEKGYKILKPVY